MSVLLDRQTPRLKHSPKPRPHHQFVPFRRYIRATALLILAMLLAIGGLNVLVDPYLRFGTPRRAGVSARKPTAIKQVRMAKAYGVCRGHFKSVLLGNSRVDVGLDPTSDSLPEFWQPVYNLGQLGTGTQSALMYLEHAATHCSIDHVIVAVDFVNHLQEPASVEHSEKPDEMSPDRARLSDEGAGTNSWTQRKQTFQDSLSAGLSLSALADSLRTIAAQSDRYSANISDQGFGSGEAFRPLIHAEGQAALFDQKNREYAERWLRQVAPEPSASGDLNALRRLLERCHERHTEVIVYIHPYHADVLEIIDAAGLWDSFEAWKRELAAICAGFDFQLWDFAEYNRFTAEEPPAPHDRSTVMQWYWESGHYRSTLGDLLMARMFAADPSGSEQFGERILPGTIDQHLAAIRESQSAYQQAMKARHVKLKAMTDGLAHK